MQPQIDEHGLMAATRAVAKQHGFVLQAKSTEEVQSQRGRWFMQIAKEAVLAYLEGVEEV